MRACVCDSFVLQNIERELSSVSILNSVCININVTLSVKTRLKSFFCDLLFSFILHMVKNIL